MKRVIEEFKEFFKPFPKVGSISYRLHILYYDIKTGSVIGDFSLKPQTEEVVSDDKDDEQGWVLDIPSYIRKYGLVAPFSANKDGDKFETDSSDEPKADSNGGGI